MWNKNALSQRKKSKGEFTKPKEEVTTHFKESSRQRLHNVAYLQQSENINQKLEIE